ncbi:hypothetical protein VTK56DRAFT_3590 [Thermocarpiscus australiensis]
MQQHLQGKHLAEKCNFCDEPLFEQWYQHFVSKHADILKSFETQTKDDEVDVSAEGGTDQTREGHWSFCSRCRGDHNVVDAHADRNQHDSVCYSSVQDRETDWSACPAYGDRIPKPVEGVPTSRQTLEHRRAVPADEQPYCEKRALPLGLFSQE